MIDWLIDCDIVIVIKVIDNNKLIMASSKKTAVALTTILTCLATGSSAAVSRQYKPAAATPGKSYPPLRLSKYKPLTCLLLFLLAMDLQQASQVSAQQT